MNVYLTDLRGMRCLVAARTGAKAKSHVWYSASDVYLHLNFKDFRSCRIVVRDTDRREGLLKTYDPLYLEHCPEVVE